MAEKSIELDSVEIAAAIFGNCDRNIRLLEKEFSVTAVCRGTMLRLSGEEANVAAAVRAVEGMLLLIENHTPVEVCCVKDVEGLGKLVAATVLNIKADFNLNRYN